MGSDRGGERAAAMYSLIVTAKLNDTGPRAWLADVLRRIGDHPASRLHGCWCMDAPAGAGPGGLMPASCFPPGPSIDAGTFDPKCVRTIQDGTMGLTIRNLLESGHVSPATRAALVARLDAPPVAVPRFLTPAEFRTLRAACARLLPDPHPESPIDVAGPMDARLAEGKSDGWRYDAMPDDRAAMRAGLAGLDGAAEAVAGTAFADALGAAQDQVLAAVQAGTPPGPAWPLPPERFFEELLAEATEVFFAHPLAQERIGYAGMADRPGWTRIGLDEREDREPE